MTTLLEIEQAIEQLPQNEYSQLLFWLGVNDKKITVKSESPKKSLVQHLMNIPKGELDLSRSKDLCREVEL